jgi:H+/Cl- antiporter ClcA
MNTDLKQWLKEFQSRISFNIELVELFSTSVLINSGGFLERTSTTARLK